MCDEEFVLKIYVTNFQNNRSKEFPGLEKSTVRVLLFSVIEPASYRKVFELWKCLITGTGSYFPVILVGIETDLRDHKRYFKVMEETNEGPITTEMGKQLARRINAEKYFEFRDSDEAGFDGLFKEVVWASIRWRKKKIPIIDYPWVFNVFCIAVVSANNSVFTDLVRRFAFDKRLNLFGEFSNEQTYFYDPDYKRTFSSFIEIDGDKHELALNHYPIINSDLEFSMEEVPVSAELDVIACTILLVFSVVDHDSYNALRRKLVIEFLKRNKSMDEPFIKKIILVGYQVDLRNDAETLSNLSKRRLQPITY